MEAHVGLVPAFELPAALLVATFAVPAVLRQLVDLPSRILTNLRSAEVMVPFVALLVLAGILRFRSNRFLLTNERIVFKTGVLFRRRHQLPLRDVETIHVEQSPLGKLANYGTVFVRATHGVSVPMVGITDPHGFQRMIQQQVEAVSAQR